MLYFLGGTPRSGKSTTARQFMSETGIPWFELDYLKMGIARGIPEFDLDPNRDDLVIAQQLWPVVKGVAMTYVENHENCLLEGAYLLPNNVIELKQMYGEEIRACFIGFTEIDTWKKVRELRDFGELTGSWEWCSQNDDEAMRKVELLKQFSMHIKAECDKHKLTYFENSTDHQMVIEDVVRFLSGTQIPTDVG